MPFEGNANDNSGNGNNGIVNGATLTDGQFGKCYLFDGVNDYIDVSYSDSLYLTSDFTISFRLKLISINTNYAEIIGNGADYGWTFFLNPNSNTLQFRIHNNNITNYTYNVGLMILSVGEWCSVTITYDSNYILTAYENGTKLNTWDTDWGALRRVPATGLGIGKVYDRSYYANCLIDDVLIYDKALSETDITRLTLGMHPLNG